MKVKANHVSETSKLYLTEGKVYTAFNVSFTPCGKPSSFTITNDRGESSFCLVERCNHLNFGDWEIVSI